MSFIESELMDLAGLVSQWAPGIYLFLPTQDWAYRYLLSFLGGAEDSGPHAFFLANIYQLSCLSFILVL